MFLCIPSVNPFVRQAIQQQKLTLIITCTITLINSNLNENLKLVRRLIIIMPFLKLSINPYILVSTNLMCWPSKI